MGEIQNRFGSFVGGKNLSSLAGFEPRFLGLSFGSLASISTQRTWLLFYKYYRTPFIQINWDAQPSGYAENPVKRILFK